MNRLLATANQASRSLRAAGGRLFAGQAQLSLTGATAGSFTCAQAGYCGWQQQTR